MSGFLVFLKQSLNTFYHLRQLIQWPSLGEAGDVHGISHVIGIALLRYHMVMDTSSRKEDTFS